MPYIKAEPGEKPEGSEKSTRIYCDEHGNKMIRSEGSRSWRNNNPGNLANFPFAKENGSIGTDGRFAIFPDIETGQRARKKLLKGSKYYHLTIKEMAYKYEPESEEKSEAYCKCIESRSKLERTRRLDSLSEEEFDRLLQSMQKCEGWEVGKEKHDPLVRINGVHRGKDRSFQMFQIQDLGWITKDDAIKIAETSNLCAIIVHMANGSKYLRSRASEPSFSELIC